MTRSSHGEVPPGLTLYSFSRTDEENEFRLYMESDEEARAHGIQNGAHRIVNEVSGEVVFHNETYD